MMKMTCRKVYVPDGIGEDTWVGIQRLGHTSGTGPSGSDLQLNQICLNQVCLVAGEAVQRHFVGCRQLSYGHGDLVAGIAPGAVRAVFRHFVAEDLTFGDAEVKVFEEAGNAGEETEAPDAPGLSVIEERPDKQAAGSLSLVAWTHGDGADLGKVGAVDVECGAAHELTRGAFDDGEGVDVLADF